MKNYPNLTPDCYYSKDIFEKEIKFIFSKLWVFVGLTSTIQKNNDFLTCEVAKLPLFIQNIDGNFYAFINQCPHRMAPIHLKPFGNRKMTCKFHGWSFDESGKLMAVPNEELYNFQPCVRNELGLKGVNIKIIGKFIFINLNQNPIKIEKQFNQKIIESLIDASQYFDQQVAFTSFPVKINWKLSLEVIKDPNHIPFVHAKSFASWLDKKNDDLTLNKLPAQWLEINSSLDSLSFTSSANLKDSRPWYRDLIFRQFEDGKHLSWYLYPNMHFASVRSDYYFIQQYDPSGGDSMNFNLWVFAAKKKNNSTDFTALLRALMSAERKIIQEDVEVLLSIQKKLGPWSLHPNHGAYEYHIACQNQWYIKNILNT